MNKVIKQVKQSGFTLIELLVVISIIGILSVAVLANLQDARTSAKDTAIKQTVHSIQQMFELTRAKTGTYSQSEGWFYNDGRTSPPESLCNNTVFNGPYASQLRVLCESIQSNTKYTTNFMFWGTRQTGGMFPNTDYYSIMVHLNNGNWYCISSEGRSYEGSSPNGYIGPLTPSYTAYDQPGCYANP